MDSRRPLHDLKGPPYSLTNQCQRKTFSTEKSALLGLYPQSPPFNVVLSPARLFLNHSEVVIFKKLSFKFNVTEIRRKLLNKVCPGDSIPLWQVF